MGPPLTSERPRRWTWSKIQNWGENPEMRNQPSIIKPMISLEYTSFLDFHLNSGFWTPSRFPPLPQNLLRLPDICKKNTFCEKIGPKQSLLASAGTNVIYRLHLVESTTTTT